MDVRGKTLQQSALYFCSESPIYVKYCLAAEEYLICWQTYFLDENLLAEIKKQQIDVNIDLLLINLVRPGGIEPSLPGSEPDGLSTELRARWQYYSILYFENPELFIRYESIR